MHPTFRRAAAAAVVAVSLVAVAAPLALAHEERELGDYAIEVGLIDEPVFVGESSGLELGVTRADQPVLGLESTLKAQVIVGDKSMDLPLSAREEQPGWYQSEFIPTQAGPYTFHITGTIEGQAVDERFTSSPGGFNEVQDTAAGQFPVQFPSQADLVAQAKQGADAAAQLPIAIALGAAGLIAGLLALGVALAVRRRA
jgi:hypothetical protein